jgi:hypothetical protein
LQNSVDSTNAFQIQNAAGSSNLLVADTTNTRIAIGKATASYTLDVVGDISSSTAFRIGATAVCDTVGSTGCIAKSGSGFYVHNDASLQQSANINLISAATGSVAALFRGASGQTADILQVKDGSGNNLLAVTSSSVVIGYGGNTLTMSTAGNFEPTLSGSARHTKSIVLTPEYAGAVLDASNDATCTAISNGTMISGLDLTNFTNYYKWTTSQGSNQCYDVVVSVQIPSDFNAWTAAPTVSAYTTDKTNGTIKLEVRGTNGAVDSNFVSVTPSANSAWQTIAGSSLAGTYAANGTMTLRLRMTSPPSGDTRIGNITFTYSTNY